MNRNHWLSAASVIFLVGAGAIASAWEFHRHWQSCPVRVIERPAPLLPRDRTAPDFELPMADGRSTFRLSDYQGRKPVALIFGSYTCPFIRRSAAELERLYRQYGDEVEFCFVYTRETHAAEEWPVSENEQEGICLPQTKNAADRRERCVQTMSWMGLSMPAAIDSQNDDVARKYD